MNNKGQVPWNKGKKGLQIAWNKGKKLSDAHRAKMFGRVVSPETRLKMSEAKKRNPTNYWLGKKRPGFPSFYFIHGHFTGDKHPRWVHDRTMLKKQNRRNDPAYVEWVKTVKNRDGWKCKIDNTDCEGKIEAHHILGWAEYVELRYEINNGITLCHAHHPRKKAEEKRLQSEFQALVSAPTGVLCS